MFSTHNLLVSLKIITLKDGIYLKLSKGLIDINNFQTSSMNEVTKSIC